MKGSSTGQGIGVQAEGLLPETTAMATRNQADAHQTSLASKNQSEARVSTYATRPRNKASQNSKMQKLLQSINKPTWTGHDQKNKSRADLGSRGHSEVEPSRQELIASGILKPENQTYQESKDWDKKIMKEFGEYIKVPGANQRRPSHKSSVPVLDVVQKMPPLTHDLKAELFAREENQSESVTTHQRKRDRKKQAKQQIKNPFEDSRDPSEFNELLGDKCGIKKPNTSFRQNEEPIESISGADMSPYTNLTETKRILTIMSSKQKKEDSEPEPVAPSESAIQLNSYKWGSQICDPDLLKKINQLKVVKVPGKKAPVAVCANEPSLCSNPSQPQEANLDKSMSKEPKVNYPSILTKLKKSGCLSFGSKLQAYQHESNQTLMRFGEVTEGETLLQKIEHQINPVKQVKRTPSSQTVSQQENILKELAEQLDSFEEKHRKMTEKGGEMSFVLKF